MKKVISFLLSIVMMFSVISGVSYTSYSAEGTDYLSEDDIMWFTNKFLYTLTESEKAVYGDVLKKISPNVEWSGNEYEKVKVCVDKIQSYWNKINPLLPATVTDNDYVKLGNNLCGYFSCTIGVLKNVYYITNADTNNIQKAYHYLKSFNSICNTLGWSLGPLSPVLSAVTATLPIAEILYSSVCTESLNFYEIDLQTAYWTDGELPTPSEASVQPLFQKYINDEKYTNGLNALYIKYSFMRMADKMKSITIDTPVNEKCYFNGHAYQVFNINKIWTDAKSYCESIGGHLVTITSESENEFVYSIALKAKQSDFYAIGATDIEEEGKWKWLNGDSFNYNNWGKNEPNNSTECCGKGQHYAFLSMISNSGTISGRNFSYEPKNWNDMCIEVKYGFICEWDNYIDPYPTMDNEHHYTQTVIAPTCTTDGYTINKCTDCDLEYYSNNISKLGHNYSFNKTVAPTCTAQGYDLYKCTRCTSTENRNKISAKGHSYSFTKTVAPTCTVQGYDIYTCSACKSTEKRNTVSANGHKYAFTKTVDPTCTAQGYDLYTCSVCNSTEKRNTVSATDHNYEEKSNTATCTEKGTKTYVCSKCGNKKTEESSSLGHSYNKVYTAPTCTESGGYTNTCTRCSNVTHSIYEAKGHDYGTLIGKAYIDKISDSSISATPNYFNEFYHTSSSIGSASKVATTSTNIAVPNEIRLDISNLSEIENFQFGIKGGIFLRKSCSGMFAYDKTTGRTPEQSAIPYTDKDGNLVNMNYLDYKTNNKWVCGEYLLNNNQITDISGTVVCTDFTQTRPHIVYTHSDAVEKGIMNSDGTINVSLELVETQGVSFSAGIPGVYFTPTRITSSNSRRFFEVFGFDDSRQGEIKAGKFDVNICFYNTAASGLTETTIKVYDDSLITKTPATALTDEKVTYTCIDCGETHTDTCKLNIADFKIKTVSLSLESSITMNFKVLKSAVADFKNPYVVFNCEGDELTVTDYTEQGDYYVFSYPGISPQLMNDNVKAVLHATHNGIDYTSPEKIMSVRTYAYTMLERYNFDDYAELRTLLVDLLNYGAASQKYIGYQTDNLVNADLTDEQKAWGTSTAPTFENIRDYNYKTIDKPTSKWVGSGLVLNNSVMVRAKFSADNIENKTIVITCGKGTFTYSKDDFVQDKDGNYYVYCNEIFANEMSEEILLTVYDNGVQCSNTMRFSIESYAKLVHDNYNGTALDELTTAMMRYGNSAKAYGA